MRSINNFVAPNLGAPLSISIYRAESHCWPNPGIPCVSDAIASDTLFNNGLVLIAVQF